MAKRGSRQGSRGKGLPKTETQRRNEATYWFEKKQRTSARIYVLDNSLRAAIKAELIAKDHIGHIEMWYIKELKNIFPR